uniref:Uncharacterized protein n=1 Tax=Physcomitrium patens TaxID=3218 RepID=A0A2K1IXC3_PHYPA|nr:hypothetical protein PHYPA_023734 [Physcomitrium patens]
MSYNNAVLSGRREVKLLKKNMPRRLKP